MTFLSDCTGVAKEFVVVDSVTKVIAFDREKLMDEHQYENESDFDWEDWEDWSDIFEEEWLKASVKKLSYSAVVAGKPKSKR